MWWDVEAGRGESAELRVSDGEKGREFKTNEKEGGRGL